MRGGGCAEVVAPPLLWRGAAAGTPSPLGPTFCSERYLTQLRCANRSWLFSRRVTSDPRQFATLGRQRGADAAAPPRPFVGVPHEWLLSHNLALSCEAGALLAYGGMAHPPRWLALPEAGVDWLGDDVGIATAAAAPRLPLRWSAPLLVRSGSKRGTACVHRISPLQDCEYDGKLSVVRWRGRRLLFTRSNLRRSSGGRHVQLTSSRDGVTQWTRFQQLRIEGFAAGEELFDIYFFSVRVLRLHGRAFLLGVFPGIVEGFGGVFVTTSDDGLHWSRAVRVIKSRVIAGRVNSHPVDGAHVDDIWGLERHDELGDQVPLAVQHNVDNRICDNDKCDFTCAVRPHVCVYLLNGTSLLAMHDEGASSMPPTVVSRDIETAEQANLRLSLTQAADCPDSPKMLEKAESTRQYLTAVYPAAAPLLRQMSAALLAFSYRQLDYIYAGCSEQALSQLRPATTSCTSMHDNASSFRSSTPPQLPYVPPGAWFHAVVRPTPPRPFQEACFGCFPRPVLMVTRKTAHQLPVSSLGAKVGPAPAWTSINSLVRYVLYPNGLVPRPRPANKLAPDLDDATDSIYFDLTADHRVARLLTVSDGEFLEVEQWGGWSSHACPPICGLWANVWKGTGVAMRLQAPFASLNKATAVVEMLLELGRRDAETSPLGRPSRLEELAGALRVKSPAAALCKMFPEASFASCVAAQLVADNPCEAASAPIAHRFKKWIKASMGASPDAIVSSLLQLGQGGTNKSTGAHRFAIYWLYGVCGVGGPKARTGLGWDELLTTLACVLGHKSVVLAASSNDNGLLHQEVVDFSLPGELGWPEVSLPQTDTNAIASCIDPFSWSRKDKRAGPHDQTARRIQLHAFYKSTSKFALPSGSSTFSHPIPRYAPTQECDLHFGPPDGMPFGDLAACRITGEDEELPPSAKKACWAWCKHTMSQTHASTSLFHVRAA